MHKEELKFIALEMAQLWNDYCSAHTDLYDETCEEYVHLLASDIENIEKSIELKQTILKRISHIDKTRLELMSTFSPEAKFQSVVKKLRLSGLSPEATQLEKMNLILIDIIQKVQAQNKKNQLFLNKAIHSLRELQTDFAGKVNKPIYGRDGQSRANVRV